MATEAQCLAALAVHEDRLAAIDGVNGLGIGDGAQGCCVNVYIESAGNRIPPDFPDTLGYRDASGDFVEVPVKVVSLGTLHPL